MFVSTRPRKFDWNAIRDFYEAGHSAQESQQRFGISNGAWYSAVQRGDIRIRLAGKTKPRGETRRAVQALLAEGTPQAQIAQALGLSKATVCYHARQLGIPPKSVAAPTSDWEEICEYYERGHSAADCQRRFGITVSAWSGAVATGRIQTRPRLEPLDAVLANGRPRSRRHVKARLLAAGLKEPRCETCGLSKWRSKPIALELHHINGDGRDNRADNLVLLCPNCHSQTANWGGRNKGKGGTPKGADLVA